MCKAIVYAKQLQEVMNNINQDYEYYKNQARISDLIQQDILHELENMDKLSASDGYKIARRLKDTREQRRQLKNEEYTLRQLKDFINNTNKGFKSTCSRIERMDVQTSTPIYNKRVVDGVIVNDR